jgi:hypothetical protein
MLYIALPATNAIIAIHASAKFLFYSVQINSVWWLKKCCLILQLITKKSKLCQHLKKIKMPLNGQQKK